MTKLESVLQTADFPLAELCAARLDGELFALDEAFIPIDTPETAVRRAQSLYLHCRGRLIAEQRSAAWIWGATEHPPARHELCARMTARRRSFTVQRSTVREVVIDDDEIHEFDGILVTSLLRTTLDIARTLDTFTAQDAAILGRLIEFGGLTLADMVQALNRRRNLPHKVRALRRVKQALRPIDPDTTQS
jgi:hypothetical protein